MADVSYVSAPNGFTFVRGSDEGTPQEYGTLLSAVAAGDPLVWDTTGKLKAHTAASASERIVGVAAASGIAGDEIPFVPATADNIFEAELTGATQDVNNIKSLTTTREIVGTTGSFSIGTATTNGQILILGWAPAQNIPGGLGFAGDPGFGNTTTNGRVLCKFIKSAWYRAS